jgi:hypothetical protein
MSETQPAEMPPPEFDELQAQPESSQFIVLWPGIERAGVLDREAKPTPAAVVNALSRHFGCPITIEQDLSADAGGAVDMLFAAAVNTPAVAGPMLFWAEAAQPLSDEELPDERAQACRWAVGVATAFESSAEGRAIDDWHAVMRTLAQAFPHAPAILDCSADAWYTRDSLDRWFGGHDIGAPARNLWSIQAARHDATHPGGGGNVWLRTHGLSRFGVPDLEMFEVPADHAQAAAELLDHLADLFLDAPLDEQRAALTGQPLEVGPGMTVTLHPWRDIAPTLDPASPGGVNDRAALGASYVVCGSQPRGSYRRIWTWPAEVALAQDDRVIYNSRYTTARQARMAQATWPVFTAFFASAFGNDPAPLEDAARPAGFVEGRFASIGDGAQTEDVRQHLWVRIDRATSTAAEGVLLDPPIDDRLKLKPGQRVRVSADAVADWRFVTDGRVCGPEDALLQCADAAGAGETMP